MLWNYLELIAVFSIPLALVAVPLGILAQTVINYRRGDNRPAAIFGAAVAMSAVWIVISLCMTIVLFATWHDPSGQQDTSAATVTLAAIYALLGGATVYSLKFLRKPRGN